VILVESGGLGIKTCCRSTSEGARIRASWIALISEAKAVNGGKVGNGLLEVDDTERLSNGDAVVAVKNATKAKGSRVVNILWDVCRVMFRM
jgi:hypothetical protein